ncbi:MAG: P1 family peptidase [Nitrospinae bacterium]|nr:P1 family peptidase [Nitrospinota bacterium]MBF0633963.1 P1 family peptidase [Nitrospinota bacterium]
MNPASQSSRLVDVSGVRVGHYTDAIARTGVTAVIFDKSSIASVHVAGGAPGSQETDLLDPSCVVGGVDAIVLTGGSAFGLSTAAGARKYLEERGRGFPVGPHRVPIVPAAVIFDLSEGEPVKPGPDEGYKACADSEKPARDEGFVGAGAGATVGKYMGIENRSRGGLASRSVVVEGGVSIGALMVVNSYGAIVDSGSGRIIAGPKDASGNFVSYLDSPAIAPSFGNTAIGVVVTDCLLTKADAKRVAVMAHDGLARAVNPCHTPYDGDMIFVVSTGERRMETARLGAWAALLVEACVVGAVRGDG